MPKHPDDRNGNWDYNSVPDIDKYLKEDGNLDRYSDDYDSWESDQYEDD